MAIVNARNLVDSETRTVRMFEINNDTNSAGEYGFHGKQPLITNPESSGVTGDIKITNASAVTGTFIIEVVKAKGYNQSGQTR